LDDDVSVFLDLQAMLSLGRSTCCAGGKKGRGWEEKVSSYLPSFLPSFSLNSRLCTG
jgi:hypothetical protein